jgi:hypothetical protein
MYRISIDPSSSPTKRRLGRVTTVAVRPIVVIRQRLHFGAIDCDVQAM